MALRVHLSIFLMLYDTIWWQDCAPESKIGAVNTGKDTEGHGCFKPRTSLISSAVNCFWYTSDGSVLKSPCVISCSVQFHFFHENRKKLALMIVYNEIRISLPLKSSEALQYMHQLYICNKRYRYTTSWPDMVHSQHIMGQLLWR